MKQFELTPLRRAHVDRLLTTYPEPDDTSREDATASGPGVLADIACEDCGQSFTAYRNVTKCIFCGSTDIQEC